MLLGGCRPTLAEWRALGESEREALVDAGRQLLGEAIAGVVLALMADPSEKPAAATSESDAIIRDLAAGFED